MVTKPFASGEYPNNVALLYINIPMLHIWIGVVQNKVAFFPYKAVTTKKFQQIGKAFII